MIQIGRKEIYWNYASTFLKIASSVLLIPFILRMMTPEMVGIWTVFMTITAFSSLLDFGFGPSFTRNVTYVFSGVRTLKATGFESVTNKDQTVDYGLLKGVITSMRWFYLRMAIVLFLLLATLGTYYIYSLLLNYKGNHQEVFIAWMLLCLINSYNLFSLYYDSLLEGKGLVKRSKQIIIIGQTIYLIIAVFLIMFGYGLIAIISAQASSVIIVRWLSYHSFFTKEIKQILNSTKTRPNKEVLRAISPNALKMGMTSLGGFMLQRSSIIIGSLYLTLEQIASYGITMQLIAVIAGLSTIYTATYQPKIAQLRIENENTSIKELYLKGQFVILLTFILGGTCLLILGEWALSLIGSQTHLMPLRLIAFALILSFEQSNLGIAGGILLSRNEVPFFKAAIISGITTVVGLFIFFHFTQLGLLTMLLIPLLVDISYQTWKWPLEVIKDLDITFKDIFSIINKFIKQ